MNYGDSTTGTYAGGPVGLEKATIAEVSITGQYFAAVNATNNTVVKSGAAGIIGLGFPAGRCIFILRFHLCWHTFIRDIPV